MLILARIRGVFEGYLEPILLTINVIIRLFLFFIVSVVLLICYVILIVIWRICLVFLDLYLDKG
jgi:hypothetical protein